MAWRWRTARCIASDTDGVEFAEAPVRSLGWGLSCSVVGAILAASAGELVGFFLAPLVAPLLLRFAAQRRHGFAAGRGLVVGWEVTALLFALAISPDSRRFWLVLALAALPIWLAGEIGHLLTNRAPKTGSHLGRGGRLF